MIPHKSKRGAAALDRLKVFEGIPAPYDKVKRMVVPDALKVLRLQHGHRFCKLGDLSTAVRLSSGVRQTDRQADRQLMVSTVRVSFEDTARLLGSGGAEWAWQVGGFTGLNDPHSECQSLARCLFPMGACRGSAVPVCTARYGPPTVLQGMQGSYRVLGSGSRATG
jgi:hypothetical protein